MKKLLLLMVLFIFSFGIFAACSREVKVIFDFNYEGGPENQEFILKKGQKVAELEVPEREGATFFGWYNGQERWSFDKPVKKSMTLKANWDGDKIVEWYNLSQDATYLGGSVKIYFWHRMGAVNEQILQTFINGGTIDLGNNNIATEKVTVEGFNEWVKKELGIEQSNIEIVAEKKPGSYPELTQAVKMALPVNGEPHLVESYGDHVAAYAQSKKPLALNNFISNPNIGYSAEEIADFVPGYWNEGQLYDGAGTFLNLPGEGKSTEALFYNKTFFDLHGLTVPRTWEEIEVVARTIKQNAAAWGVPADSVPLGYDSEDNLFITASEQKKIPYTGFDDIGKGKVLFNNQASKDMVSYFKGLVDEGLLTSKQLQGGQYTSDLFKAQKLFMSVGSTGGTSYNVSPDFVTAVAPAPQFDLSNKKIIQQGPNINLFKKDNEQEMIASFLFLKYLCDPTISSIWGSKTGYSPVRYSSYETDAWATYTAASQKAGASAATKLIYDVLAMAKEEAPNFFTSPCFDRSSKTRDEVGSLLGTVFLAKETGQALLTLINNKFTTAYNAIMW
ncbi:MAG: extracellular solute-binding protein [Acholeplasmatales bacterium]|jgi:multiple sugar transport system substrate-binding protein|nr:extracellular solute-binding protein [Acholeplasmatales bacterium]